VGGLAGFSTIIIFASLKLLASIPDEVLHTGCIIGFSILGSAVPVSFEPLCCQVLGPCVDGVV
jgi:hypothetical protein